MENKTSDQKLAPQLPLSLPVSKKWYQHKGIIVIILLAIVAGLTTYFSPSAELAITNHQPKKLVDTSQWQIYNNYWHGFELKYPPDWQLKVNSPDGPNLTRIIISPKCGVVSNNATTSMPLLGIVPCYYFEVYIGANPDDLPVKDYTQKRVSVASSKLEFQKQYSIPVNKYDGYELYGVVENKYGINNTTEQIYVTHKKLALAFDLLLTEDPKLINQTTFPIKNNPIAHEIVNTLIFTK